MMDVVVAEHGEASCPENPMNLGEGIFYPEQRDIQRRGERAPGIQAGADAPAGFWTRISR